jgi:MFS family permease
MSGFLARFRPIGRALAHRNFAVYTAGNSVSLIGTWMQRVAVGWLTWQLTESGAWLGLIAFADLFPTILIGPIAGAVADRFVRLTLNNVTMWLALLQAGTLFALTLTGLIDVWLLFGLTAFLGVTSAFNQPARLALISSLVPRPELATAVAVNSVTVNTARFIGPALAGLLIVTVGVAAAFALNMASFAAMLWALSRIRIAPDGDGRAAKGPFLRDIAEGVRYAARHPGIAAVLAPVQGKGHRMTNLPAGGQAGIGENAQSYKETGLRFATGVWAISARKWVRRPACSARWGSA